MKKVALILGGLAAVLFIVVLVFLGYIGMFSDYKAEIKEMGPYTFVYESFTGPYKDTKTVFDRVYKKLENKGIKTERGFGIYYDDPSKVESSKLRSDCGSVIETKDMEKFNKVRDSFNVKEIPASRSLVVTFPIKNAMSYMFGPMKAYSVLNDAVKSKKFKVKNAAYELYDVPNKVIYFVMPIQE